MPDNIVYKVIPTEPFETVPSRCIAKPHHVKGETVLSMSEKDYLSVKDKCKVVEKLELVKKSKKMLSESLNKMMNKSENKSVNFKTEKP